MNQKSREILFGSIRWLMIAMASTMVLLFIAAFFFWKTEISERYLQLFAFISCGIGSLIVGFGGGRIIQKRDDLWSRLWKLLFVSDVDTFVFHMRIWHFFEYNSTQMAPLSLDFCSFGNVFSESQKRVKKYQFSRFFS